MDNGRSGKAVEKCDKTEVDTTVTQTTIVTTTTTPMQIVTTTTTTTVFSFSRPGNVLVPTGTPTVTTATSPGPAVVTEEEIPGDPIVRRALRPRSRS